jgi:hypothetical protein
MASATVLFIRTRFYKNPVGEHFLVVLVHQAEAMGGPAMASRRPMVTSG